MKSKMIAICVAIAAMFGTQTYGQECATCSDVNPCNTCVSCTNKPCELFAGLKNLMACKPCASACAAVAPACEPVVAAPVCTAPVVAAPACAPACEVACVPCHKPILKPFFRDFFALKACAPCTACTACDAAPACAAVAPACEPVCKSCGIFGCKGACRVAPACDPVCAAPAPACAAVAPACEPVCETVSCGPMFPNLVPSICSAVQVPVIGAKRAMNGLFVCLADATAPKCCTCAPACDVIAEPCGPACVAAPQVNTVVAPVIKANTLPASPEAVKAPAKAVKAPVKK
ncbi:MAG: hypothetical protein Q4G69_04025 [Planctomycetia bacterium]|nr:hypothetical protein [Planctomycetia bacterium]